MYAAGGAGGAMMSDGLKGMAQGVADLQEAVGNGAKLERDAAKALIQSLENGVRRVEAALQDSESFHRDGPPIGTTPGAKTYKPVYAAVNNDPVQGADVALVHLKRQLEDAKNAVKASVKDWETTDAGAATNLGKADG